MLCRRLGLASWRHINICCRTISTSSDPEILQKLNAKELPHFKLEDTLDDYTRAVKLRRQFYGIDDLDLPGNTEEIDVEGFYRSIYGTNCESVVGYITVPVGIVGPMMINGRPEKIPMATTEGALVASTNCGAKAINACGGATVEIVNNGMTRAPLVRLPTVGEAADLVRWLEAPATFDKVSAAFNSTTNHGKLLSVMPRLAGRNVYIRFKCATGDATGMNMVTKGTQASLLVIKEAFPSMRVASISGNMCADKKPSAVNWIEGRGRSIVCEAVISKDVVEKTLHTTVDDLVALNVNKNLVGSALSGSLGGFNAHASNIVSAVFLATGNDIAQNVESSTCMTLMEREGDDLHLSVTMPTMEVGTVGGGTTLPAQAACLDMIGVRGPADGNNAHRLAGVVGACVMAGELSLMAALAADHLVESHMRLNRKTAPSSSSSSSSSASTSQTAQARRHMSHVSPAVNANMTPSPQQRARSMAEMKYAARMRTCGAAPLLNEYGAGPWQSTHPSTPIGTAHKHSATQGHWYGDDNQGPGIGCMC